MRTFSVALALAAGLAAGGSITTQAQAADVAPTNVQVRWKDSSHRYVVISWDEPEPQANQLMTRTQDGKSTRYLARRKAEQPNVAEVDARYIGSVGARPVQILVAAGTGENGPAGASVAFDAQIPAPPQRVSTSLAADGAVTVRWKPTPLRDTTPGDPLDLPVRPSFQVSYRPRGAILPVPIGGPTEGRQVTYTLRTPYGLSVTALNEWGDSYGDYLLYAEPTKLTAKVPAWAVYGRGTANVTGTVTGPSGERRPIVLQARNTSTSPWYTVQSFPFGDGRFSFALGTGGSRQYRVVAPPALHWLGDRIDLGAATAAASSTTQLDAYGFRSSTNTLQGSPTTVGVSVHPQGTTTAVLQRWTGRTWATVRQVPVRRGEGGTPVVHNTPGRYPYRYYVPAFTYGANRFAAAYTGTVVVDVVRR